MADPTNPQPVSTASTPTVTPIPGPRPHPTGVRGFFHFLAWVFTGFGIIGMFRRKGEAATIDEVVVYSVHRSFFLWPLILVGFITGALLNHHLAHAAAIHRVPTGRMAHILGWIYLWVLLYTFIVMMFDVGTITLILSAFVLAFLWISSEFMEVKNIHIISGIMHYLKGLQPQLDPGFAILLSWLLLVPWIGSLFQTFTRGRKTFTPNGVEEWVLGTGTEITDRSGLHFSSHYRDLLKMLIGFGSGDMEAADSMGKSVKHWPNILFLAFFWPRIEEILQSRAAMIENNPVEVQSVRR